MGLTMLTFIFALSWTLSLSKMNFTHPGALDSIQELNFVKNKIKTGQQPWLNWFNIARHTWYATRTPHGVTSFDANSGAAQDAGDDALASYLQALLWYYTDNITYAKSSINILNSWSKLQSITANNEQNMLQAGWMGADFAPAAEIMRMYSDWLSSDIIAFQNMLKRVFYPLLNNMSYWNGNVDLTQIDAMMSISVFNEDEYEFNLGLSRLQTRMPSYIYLTSDGPPSNNVPPPIDGNGGNNQAFWSNPVKWVNGLMQETCRDNGHHVQYGLGSAIHACEVAWNQGVDVYSVYQDRITAALELLALQLSTGNMQGTCQNNQATTDKYDTWEIGYSHYYYISKVNLTNTNKFLVDYLRVTTDNTEYCQPKYTSIYGTWNLVFETLSHANIDINDSM